MDIAAANRFFRILCLTAALLPAAALAQTDLRGGGFPGGARGGGAGPQPYGPGGGGGYGPGGYGYGYGFLGGYYSNNPIPTMPPAPKRRQSESVNGEWYY